MSLDITTTNKLAKKLTKAGYRDIRFSWGANFLLTLDGKGMTLKELCKNVIPPSIEDRDTAPHSSICFGEILAIKEYLTPSNKVLPTIIYTGDSFLKSSQGDKISIKEALKGYNLNARVCDIYYWHNPDTRADGWIISTKGDPYKRVVVEL